MPPYENTSTRFGIELDSLSRSCRNLGVRAQHYDVQVGAISFRKSRLGSSLSFVACGALRLARFNVQTGAPGSKAFKGMPIPAAATILASVVIFYYDFWTGVPDKNAFLPVITIVLSLLMVRPFAIMGERDRFQGEKTLWALIFRHGALHYFLSGLLLLSSYCNGILGLGPHRKCLPVLQKKTNEARKGSRPQRLIS